jgi:hypothetical protein
MASRFIYRCSEERRFLIIQTYDRLGVNCGRTGVFICNSIYIKAALTLVAGILWRRFNSQRFKKWSIHGGYKILLRREEEKKEERGKRRENRGEEKCLFDQAWSLTTAIRLITL